jgi:hypothetical protein
MNKEFIPYEQALKLKELGFDEPCLVFYTYEGKFSNELSFNEYKNTGLKTSAPLYQQAFRWFRDKHGLCIVIKPIDDKKLDLGYNLLKNGLIMSTHLTHEEAELECLKKLIELVKNK